jgi:hypothetical protein
MVALSHIPLVSQARRHHALEHATIHILSRRYPTHRFAGWSTPFGFYLRADVPVADVRAAVSEAMTRLGRGEWQLAIHPRCGTNTVTAGALVGLTAFLTMLPGDHRSRRARLPLVVLLSTLALLFAQSLGPIVQQHVTTDASQGAALEATISRGTAHGAPVYRVQLHTVERA